MRLLSLIAIKDQNEALAGMIKKATETGDAFGSLIEVIRASIRAMLDKIAADVSQLQALTSGGVNTPVDQQRSIIREKLNLAMPDISALQNRLSMNNASINTSSGGSPTYIINAQGIGDQQIAAVVQGAIQDLNRYGNSTTYAGAI
jgi:Arc/MetJ-type ribon-helix-helix transcriptional regulator